LATGLIVGAYRRRFEVETAPGTVQSCAIRGRTLVPACGDRVDLEAQGKDEAVIVSIRPRRSMLARQDAWRQKIVAANVDTVIGVVAVSPPFNPDLLDRWAVAAEAAQCRFVLVVNKIDLPDADGVVDRFSLYAKLGYAVVPLRAKQGIDPLRPYLAGAHSVLVGQSGMGKSTIINAATGEARAKTGAVSAALNAGTHTTTHTRLHHLDGDAWIVDSPGMQEFGLNQLSTAELEHAFVDFRPHLGNCRFRNCAHAGEPGCAIRAAVESGAIAQSRYAAYRRIRGELDR
jgi:ribosome biogenesis GTPase